MVLASENELRMMPLRQKKGDWTVELRRMMGSPMINWWPWQQLGDFRISKHFKPGWFIVPKIVGQTPETWSCCGDRNGCEPSIPYPSTLRSRSRELSTFSDSVWIHRDLSQLSNLRGLTLWWPGAWQLRYGAKTRTRSSWLGSTWTGRPWCSLAMKVWAVYESESVAAIADLDCVRGHLHTHLDIIWYYYVWLWMLLL